MNAMTWEILEATWKGLVELADLYKPLTEPYAALTEARRLVEIEMRQGGYEALWRELTQG